MPNLHINYHPRMTKHVVAQGAFASDPLIVVDVGARGGVESYWAAFEKDIRFVAFEPDPAECERLRAEAAPNLTVLPHALGRTREVRKFHVATLPQASSFYPTDQAFGSRFNFGKQMKIESVVDMETTTLAEVLGHIKPDFIKLDAEGAELEILQAANLGGVLGFVAEVRFTERMSGCPTFSDLDLFCRDIGYELYDLDLYRYSRTTLPYPFLYDFRNERGEPAAGATIQGQILTGDALYLVDGLTTTKPLKLACLFEIFGLVDCAAEVILRHGLDRGLLELLVPSVKGEQLSYSEYQRRSATSDSLFRPTPGLRFPDGPMESFDGTFTHPWQQKPKGSDRDRTSPRRTWDRLKMLFGGRGP